MVTSESYITLRVYSCMALRVSWDRAKIVLWSFFVSGTPRESMETVACRMTKAMSSGYCQMGYGITPSLGRCQ
jgi:hypothetical protein